MNRQERGASWLAKKLSCDRTNIYNIYSRRNIDCELLFRLSLILQHNFMEDLKNDYDEINSTKM